MYTIERLLGVIVYLRKSICEDNAIIEELAYDTRKIHKGSEALFFALKHQRDGHNYIQDAYEKGVRSYVITDLTFDTSPYVDCNFIWVEDALHCIQAIAKFHRDRFSYPVIGITGSNGKTIVKEWLYQLLRKDYACYQSPKSYNSQLGVALSLWKLNGDYNLAIIEAGISRAGEMARLQAMIQPTLGVLTSLGTAHQEGFLSVDQKFDEKWKLFDTTEVVVMPHAALKQDESGHKTIRTWGYSPQDYLYITGLNKRLKETYVGFECAGGSHRLVVPFTDQASIENVLTCTVVMLHLGYGIDAIQERVALLKPLEMRLQLKRGKNNLSIVDDSYSNDLASLQIALDFLSQQNQHQSKKIVLSDFDGIEWTATFEEDLLRLLNGKGLDTLYFVGERYTRLKGKIVQAYFYDHTEDLYNDLARLDWRDSTVLVKGARKFHLERITAALVEQSHETVLEINLNAIEHNIQQYRAKLAPEVKMMAMVKAFSYGAGSFEVANVLEFNKIDYLTVAFVDEGVALRKGGITLPIMVLSPHESSFEDLVSYNLEPEIYSIRILNSFVDFVNDRGVINYPIHIKLDTGMHRLGFMEEDMSSLLLRLSTTNRVRVVSVFSHLVGAGDPDLMDFTKDQIKLFLRLSEVLEDQLGYKVLKHICNTSGIIHHPEVHLDMVRLGIGLYGFDMAPKGIQLANVSLLKTTISQIKHLPKTETVGYDRKGVLKRDSVIATVKIGYADGYNRRFGNGVGKMTIHGKSVPTIGNICMDMCMLDITDVEANEGDEVVVFPDLAHAAKEIGTIPYELLTGISSRVKRVYFYE